MTDHADAPSDDGSESTLWAAVLAGDAEAFEAVYDRHVDTVHRLLLRRVGAQEAPDLTAEVFARAWTHRARIEPAESKGVLPWLLGTALNLVRQHEARTATDGRLARTLAQRAFDHADPIADVLDAVDDEAALRRARVALASLSADDQDVLELCVLEGLSTGEAALALGQQPSTVRSRLSRARRRLAAAYEASGNGGAR